MFKFSRFNIFISLLDSKLNIHDNNCLLKLPNTNNWVILIYSYVLMQKQHIWLAATERELNCCFFLLQKFLSRRKRDKHGIN